MNDVESTDRGPVDFFLFGLGFFGFIVLDAGIIIGAPFVALSGGLIKLFTILAFHFRPSPGE